MNEEEVKMLMEMRNNCLNANVYDDENRLLKANAITKALIQNEKIQNAQRIYYKALQEHNEKNEKMDDVSVKMFNALEVEEIDERLAKIDRFLDSSEMNTNKYGEVINGKETYKKIAQTLKRDKSIMIGWTDEKYTHYDILFTLGCAKEGMYQRGIKPTDLFVSIMSLGSFGFKTDDLKYSSYIAEKLFYGRNDESVEKVTELINGVIGELNDK